MASRSVAVTIGVVLPFSTDTQVVWRELPLLYVALSMLWPVVLGGLSLVVLYLVERERAILERIRQVAGADEMDHVDLMLPYVLTSPTPSSSAVHLRRFVTWTPVAALLLHGFGLARTFATWLEIPQGQALGASEFIVAGVATGALAVGLHWCLPLVRMRLRGTRHGTDTSALATRRPRDGDSEA